MDYNTVDSLMRRMTEFERRLRTMETAPRLIAAGIGQGGIVVNDGGGITINDGGLMEMRNQEDVRMFYLGPDPGLWKLHPSGRPQQVIYITRDNGKMAFELADRTVTSDYRQFWSLYDNSGWGVVADDAVTGYGLARPWISMMRCPEQIVDWPGTTSTAFTPIDRASGFSQHPWLTVRYSTGGTAVGAGYAMEHRLVIYNWLNGVQGPTWTSPVQSGVSSYDVDVPCHSLFPMYSELAIQLQVRVSASTGTARAVIYQAFARQS